VLLERAIPWACHRVYPRNPHESFTVIITGTERARAAVGAVGKLLRHYFDRRCDITRTVVRGVYAHRTRVQGQVRS
jgi:hypothetical protein